MNHGKTFALVLLLIFAAFGTWAVSEAVRERGTSNHFQCVTAAVIDFSMAFIGIFYTLL